MTDAEAYARHWASVTDRAPSDVYIPHALREAPWETPGAETPEPSAT